MQLDHELPRLPIDWPEEEARSLPAGAEYEYRPGDARLFISWKVDSGTDFSPETEALSIATLLEQAQGFTRAFDLANLGHLRLIHQGGQWAPSTGVGLRVSGVGSASNGSHSPPVMEPLPPTPDPPPPTPDT